MKSYVIVSTKIADTILYIMDETCYSSIQRCYIYTGSPVPTDQLTNSQSESLLIDCFTRKWVFAVTVYSKLYVLVTVVR